MEVLERRDELPRIAVITFVEAPLLRAFASELRLDEVPLYGDPDRRLYDALGFGRGSVARVWLDPRVWLRYARSLRRGGRLPRRPAQDTLQLGGDALVDADGRVVWLYRSRGPEDRPAADEVVRQAQRLFIAG